MALYDYYFNTQTEYQAKYGEKTLVLIEVGMFFEIYKIENATECVGPDIQTICNICDLQLSRKNKSIIENSRANPMMAGFPSHAFSKHVQLLLNQQYTIVVIRQVTLPPNPKREITEILSPSMQITPNTPSGNFLCVSYWDFYTDKLNRRLLTLGLSGFDVSTGESWVYEIASTSIDSSRALDELMRFYQIYQPREIVFLGPNLLAEERREIEDTLGIHYDTSRSFHLLWDYKDIHDFASIKYQNEFLQRAYADHKSMLSPIDYLNLEKYENGRIAFTYMIQFAYEHNNSLIQHLKVPQLFSTQNRCILDYNSALQLQIISTQSGERPLMNILNRCATAFGSRHFHEILLQPFTDAVYIQDRYNKIAELIENNAYSVIYTELKKVYDIERMERRMLLGQFAPADWNGFDSSLHSIKNICTFFENQSRSEDKVTTKASNLFESLEFNIILTTLKRIFKEYTKKLKIDECAKYLINDIKTNIFTRGQYTEVDIIDDEYKHHYKKLENLSKAFSEIILDSARIEQNDRDGFFIQMTKKRWESILAEFTRKNKTTLTVWAKDDHILQISQFKAKPVSSSSTIVRISHPWIDETSDILTKLQLKLSYCLQKYYKEFLSQFAIQTKEDLRIIIHKIAEIDVLSTNARNAIEYNYIKPTVVATNQSSSQIKSQVSYVKGTHIRHPILERILNNSLYIPNDISLSAENTESGLLLFGMNASGKSSLMKAVGLTIIMAQAGMYVPAATFEYSPYEHIFTRISGADNIYRGWSSFTVEMMELRNILQRCNEKSLVLGDELCAGTESISALAIVTAGIDSLIRKRATFVFATHLHDLSKLKSIQDASNGINKTLRLAHMHVEVDKTSGKLIFDRQLREGTGSSLYGLEVCYGLGLPSDFLKKAHDVRSEIENVSPLLQSTKQSNYNTIVFVQECKVCKTAKATEVHHIKEQHTATSEGFIDHYHKNNAHNLVPLCEACHQQTHHGILKIHGYKDTSDGQILDFTYEMRDAPPITKTEDEINTLHTLQTMNRERLYEGIYPYLRYNRGNWYHKKTTRSKWKPVISQEALLILLKEYISKIQLVIQIDLEYEINQSRIRDDMSHIEELIHEFENILHDKTL
jgi:DNA mismatch repair protein MutS